MPNLIDLTGRRFGRWLVLNRAFVKVGESYWLCRCECGVERPIHGGQLKRGISKSCGCYSRDRSTRHGLTRTPIYNVWSHMIDRCLNPKSKQYDAYGGRGIIVCDRWLCFETFFEDMGDKPRGLSLDRVDNNGNYEPGNCRWATIEQQLRNRSNSINVEWNGEKRALVDVAQECGIKYNTAWQRLRAGWTVKEAMTKKGNE